jgi:hypothetical protein
MPTWNDLEQISVPSGCTFWKVAATAPPRQGA